MKWRIYSRSQVAEKVSLLLQEDVLGAKASSAITKQESMVILQEKGEGVKRPCWLQSGVSLNQRLGGPSLEYPSQLYFSRVLFIGA